MNDHDHTPDAHVFGPARVPADLGAEEREMAAWFSHLPRVSAGEGLRDRVLTEVKTPSLTLVSDPRSRLEWGWVMAAAAALLVAIGTLAIAGGDPAETVAPAELPAAPVAKQTDADLWVMDDPNLALFHDLETFDGLGVASGDVLALGDR